MYYVECCGYYICLRRSVMEKKKSLYMGRPVEGHWITMRCSKLRCGWEWGEYYGRDCILTQQPMWWCPPQLERFVLEKDLF